MRRRDDGQKHPPAARMLHTADRSDIQKQSRSLSLSFSLSISTCSLFTSYSSTVSTALLHVLGSALGSLSCSAEGNSNLLKQTYKPNKPVFSKGSSPQNPTPHPCTFDVRVMAHSLGNHHANLNVPTAFLRRLQICALHILFYH